MGLRGFLQKKDGVKGIFTTRLLSSDENEERKRFRGLKNLRLSSFCSFILRVSSSSPLKKTDSMIESINRNPHFEAGGGSFWAQRTMVQNSLNMGHQISHYPMSSGASEWASKRINERSGARERSKQCGASEWVSGASERASGRANGPVLTSRF